MPDATLGRAVSLRLPLVLALVIALTPALAQVYKWVDEKGVTHYSETPPPDKKASKVDTGPANAPVAPATDWKQKELDSKQRSLEQKQRDEAAHRREANDEAARRDRCLRAQRDIRVFETQAPVYRVNERGEKVYMEDNTRAAALERARQEASTYCK